MRMAELNKLIGPHQDKEYALMMYHQKPTALVGRHGVSFDNLMDAVVRGELIYRRIQILTGGTGTRAWDYGFAHPGNEDKLQRMQQIYDEAYNGEFTDELHIELGQLLGYTDKEIQEFLSVK